MDVLRNVVNFVIDYVIVILCLVFVMVDVEMERKGVIVKRVGIFIY